MRMQIDTRAQAYANTNRQSTIDPDIRPRAATSGDKAPKSDLRVFLVERARAYDRVERNSYIC